jgi:predicted transcriptional regulator
MNSQRVGDIMSQVVREQKFKKTGFFSIAAYPQNDIREIAKIMTDIRIECLPVFFSPWNKKLVGFIELNNIKRVLND